MNKQIMKIWDVHAPVKMLRSKPKQYKVIGMEEYYKRNKSFYGSVVVDKHHNIIDGYVIYYVAKKNKIEDIPVLVVSRMDRLKRFLRRVVR